MQLLTNTKFNFTGKMKWAALLSALLIAAGLSSLAVQSLNWGIDFVGGTLLRAKFSRTPIVGGIRDGLAAIGQENAIIQLLGASNEILVRVEKSEESEEEVAKSIRRNLYTRQEQEQLDEGRFDLNDIGVEPLYNRLYDADPLGMGKTEAGRAKYHQIAAALQQYRKSDGPLKEMAQVDAALAGIVEDEGSIEGFLTQQGFFGSFMVVAQESVGPSVGRELREKAYLSVAVSLFGILVYITFRFQFIYGLAAIVALFHDVLITVGLFSLTQREFSLPIVAALLTIVGYSLNDTIVVFDRIRDNLKLLRREKFPDIINASINQTLSRTILTSTTTLIVVIALYVIGGAVINGFAFALLAGVIVGTYSSVFVASALLIVWNKVKVSREERARPR